MNHTLIIGGGFCGTMTTVNLVEKAHGPMTITLINERETLNRGVAFSSYSQRHLLNVVAGKMGAFPDKPDHFLSWVMRRPEFHDKDQNLIAQSYLPRSLYGDYLCEIFANTLQMAKTKEIQVNVIESRVASLDVAEDTITVKPEHGEIIRANHCVIATGNHIPGNPKIANKAVFQSPRYFQDPWNMNAVSNIQGGPVLIIGNGLTMVDTVLGLLEKGYHGEIFSLSPNGFNILPHRHGGMSYTMMEEELQKPMSLRELVQCVNRHIKLVREHGVSAEPVIDALRPFTQTLWQRFTVVEKRVFMARLRHLWGVARHRIPLHTHDRIQQLRIDGRLHIRAGKILNLDESEDGLVVTYWDKRIHAERTLRAARAINCTGPETNVEKMEGSFLKESFRKDVLFQDELNLGIQADPVTYRVARPGGGLHPHLFTLGSTLKGVLWESTAISELREQAARLAEGIVGEPTQVPA